MMDGIILVIHGRSSFAVAFDFKYHSIQSWHFDSNTTANELFKKIVNTIPFSVLPTIIPLASVSHNSKNISNTRKYKRS